MISPHTLSDSMLTELSGQFQFPLKCTEDQYVYQLRFASTASPTLLTIRTNDIKTLRQDTDFLSTQYTELLQLREDELLLRNRVVSDTTKAAEGQLFFTGNHTRVLNSIPYLITIFVFLKIYIFPILGLLSPLLLFIAPYILIRTMFDGGHDMPWDVYVTLMKHMVFGIKEGEKLTLKQIGQLVWTLASIGQGIVQPFMTAYHTAALDKTVLARANALQKLVAKTNELYIYCKERGILSSCVLQVPIPPSESHEAAAWLDDEPLGLVALWKLLGHLSLLITIAKDTRWQPIDWESGVEFELDGFADIAIPTNSAVRSIVTLDYHAVLTGPNRGGKSSNLRGILQQILLGQTFGCTYICNGSWKPFGYIATRLKSYDSAGKESLFEMEVRHAATMLQHVQSSKVHSLILIDELFHSTNPPDAETSAILFLEQLWELSHVKSIVSTHIFSLCEMTPDLVVPLCCPAYQQADGSILYSYELCPGICKVSSVQEVLEEAGMI